MMATAEGGARRGAVIVAMKGHPGTGKTTVARAVAAALRCPLLDKDDVRDATLPIQRTLDGAPGGGEEGRALLNDLSYAVLWRMAESQVRHADVDAVVVDSPLSRRAHLDRLLAIGGARVVVVDCRPSDEAEWRRRLESRAAAEGEDGGWHKPATWAELKRLVDGYGGCTEYEVSGDVPRIVVDTTAAVETVELAKMVVDFIHHHQVDH